MARNRGQRSAARASDEAVAEIDRNEGDAPEAAVEESQAAEEAPEEVEAAEAEDSAEEADEAPVADEADEAEDAIEEADEEPVAEEASRPGQASPGMVTLHNLTDTVQYVPGNSGDIRIPANQAIEVRATDIGEATLEAEAAGRFRIRR